MATVPRIRTHVPESAPVSLFSLSCFSLAYRVFPPHFDPAPTWIQLLAWWCVGLALICSAVTDGPSAPSEGHIMLMWCAAGRIPDHSASIFLVQCPGSPD